MPGFNPNKINIYNLTTERPEREPEAFFNVERDITDEDWESMKADLEHYRGNNWSAFSMQAMRMKILDPSMDLKIGDLEIEGMKAQLEEYRGDDWQSFSAQAMEMKILDPSIDLNIGDLEIEGMKVDLEHYRGDNWQAFSMQAMEMKILVAEKVEITDKGLEITMPKKKKPLRSETPPMPKKRKF